MTNDLSKTHYVEDEDLYITPRGRANFVALARKFKRKGSKATTPDGKPDEGQFAVSLCFPPNVDIKLLKSAANDIAKGAFSGADLFVPGKSKGVKSPFINPLKLENPIILPDAEGEPIDLTGWTVIRPNSYLPKIPVRGPDGQLIDPDELEVEAYSGRWMRLMVKPKDYTNENKGVKFMLAGVQLLKHDVAVPNTGGAVTTAEAFGAVTDEEDDPLA